MSIASTNPATGQVEKSFEPHSAEQVEQKLATAHEAARQHRRTSLPDRAAKLQRAADLLDQRKHQLAKLMTLEMGKLTKAGIGEVEKCALCCRHYAGHGARYLADEPIQTDAKRSLVRHQPLGVILAVMPWNFPFWQVFRFAAPALMAGNVGLLKHASSVPQCALAIEEIFRDAGFPEGCFTTLLIGSQHVQKLVEDPRVMAATLTGSDGAGRSLGRAAGGALKKIVLELGGSDPFLILPSADLEKAVETAVKARLQNNAGQSCIASKRFIVHQQVAERFEPLFVEAFRKLRTGDPLDPQTDVGPLSSEQTLHDLEKQVDSAVKEGAVKACGGQRVGTRGFFYAPTVLLNAQGTAAFREETFGPVAAVARARDLDHAIELANDTPFGLAACAFTNSDSEAARLCDELEAGSVFINGLVKSDPRLPFGGIKASGHGRELAREGILEFTNAKTLWLG